jgi:replicative DNA helicase
MATKDMSIHIPPQNLDAEISLLGSILLDKDAIVKIADIITPDDFYKDAHGIIYKSMVDLYEHREPIDVVTLTNKLEEQKKLDIVGGASYIATLASSVPTASNVIHYAKIVSEKSVLRRLIQASSEIADIAFHEEKDIPDILDRAEQAVFAVSQKHTKESFIAIKDILIV